MAGIIFRCVAPCVQTRWSATNISDALHFLKIGNSKRCRAPDIFVEIKIEKNQQWRYNVPEYIWLFNITWTDWQFPGIYFVFTVSRIDLLYCWIETKTQHKIMQAPIRVAGWIGCLSSWSLHFNQIFGLKWRLHQVSPIISADRPGSHRWIRSPAF